MKKSEDQNPYEPPKTEILNTRAENPIGNPAESKSDADKLIVLSTFDNSIDAHLFRNELTEHGISARIGNETTTIFGATIAGPSSAFWIEVLVLQSDVEAALSIKTRWLAMRSNDEFTIPEWECQCGETVDAGFSVCWNCDADYSKPPGSPE
jgi:hypothetical protein